MRQTDRHGGVRQVKAKAHGKKKELNENRSNVSSFTISVTIVGRKNKKKTDEGAALTWDVLRNTNVLLFTVNY